MRSPSKGVCGSSRMTVIRHISKSLTLVHNAVIVIRALVRIQLIIHHAFMLSLIYIMKETLFTILYVHLFNTVHMIAKIRKPANRT
jgi:hypothetical protein